MIKTFKRVAFINLRRWYYIEVNFNYVGLILTQTAVCIFSFQLVPCLFPSVEELLGSQEELENDPPISSVSSVS